MGTWFESKERRRSSSKEQQQIIIISVAAADGGGRDLKSHEQRDKNLAKKEKQILCF